MKRLIALLGSMAMIGTTAATVGAWTNQTKVLQQVDWSVLEAKIKEAQGLLETNKDKAADESLREALQDLIAEALAFVEEHQATQEEVDQVVLVLEIFMEMFENSIKDQASLNPVDRSSLRQTIVYAFATIKASPQKTKEAKEQLYQEIQIALGVLNDPLATQEKLDGAQKRLEDEIQIFNNSPNTLVFAV